jgi:Ca-activated chloride channel family protein
LFNEGNPDDSASLYTFNWEVTLRSSFTRRLARIEASLRQLHAEAGTSLYDAIFLAARDLEGRDGRHVMVVVTDGGDTTSTKNFHEALEAIQLADGVMYPIVVVPITNEVGRNVGGEHALTTFAAGTGGRTFFPGSAGELDSAFSDILRELRTQYLIGYYPRNIPLTKDRFHSLRVTVSRPSLRVLTRTGYYGEFEDSTRKGRQR